MVLAGSVSVVMNRLDDSPKVVSVALAGRHGCFGRASMARTGSVGMTLQTGSVSVGKT